MKKLFNDTINFFKETQSKAILLNTDYHLLEEEIPAYDVDKENFIAEILRLCTDYEHITC